MPGEPVPVSHPTLVRPQSRAPQTLSQERKECNSRELRDGECCVLTQPAMADGNIQKVKHVIIIMQEKPLVR